MAKFVVARLDKVVPYKGVAQGDQRGLEFCGVDPHIFRHILSHQTQGAAVGPRGGDRMSDWVEVDTPVDSSAD